MEEKRNIKLIPILLVVLPVWLFISAGLALVKKFKDEKEEALEAEKRFALSVSIPSITDDLRKIVTVIGERNTSQPEQLRAMASMIAGQLGPSNIGYEVKTIQSPAEFPILQISILGSDDEAAPIWLLTSYDSPVGSRGGEKNASGLAATIAVAQDLANTKPKRSIHFLFLPHVNDAQAPVNETTLIASNLIKQAPGMILCIEAMAHAETLIVSSRDSQAPPSPEMEGLGKILGADVTLLDDGVDLSSKLFAMDIPAIRVSTRSTLLANEADDKVPFAPTLASSTGRLIELVRRLSKIGT